MKCEKSGFKCPGYRQLDQLLFRDESDRVIKNLCKTRQSKSVLAISSSNTSLVALNHGCWPCPNDLMPVSVPPTSISPQLSVPTHDIGANFFFAKYAMNDHPDSGDYQRWLAISYHGDLPSNMLRAAIEAVGMAGISNVSYAPHIAAISRKRYQGALAAMKQALSDPVEAVADTTFMTVIVLGLYEVWLLKHLAKTA